MSVRAHTVAQVRAAEAALMATLPTGTLMQRAAAGLAAIVAGRLLARRGRVYGTHIAVLAGSGDNGGDALFAGARLARRGAAVTAVLLAPERAHGGGLAALRAAGGRVVPVPEGASLPAPAATAVGAADAVLDGIVGIGGHPGLRLPAAAAVGAIGPAADVVAVDVPSGIDVDTGEVPAACVHATATVTFGTAKIGLLVDPGAAAAGDVHLVDIGLTPHLDGPAVERLEAADAARLVPRPERTAHKYTRGVLGVLAGSAEYAGAAVLVTGGALRTGIGMVRYAGADAAAALVRGRHPEVVTASGRVQAWVVGSGLGAADRSAEVAAAFAAGVPVLLDADGLRYLPDRFAGPALLTPHAGELARLLGVERADVEARRLHHAREAARRWRATVLLKGATTVVAATDGRVRVAAAGTPELATAGTGDVLSGVCGALLAAGLSPLDAGAVGAYLHGVAGGLASAGAPVGAQDVVDALPAAIRATLGAA